MGRPPRKSPRRVTVVTGSRAEFGLLAPVMRAIEAHPKLALHTVVTGAHLVSSTWRDVERAGFRIDAKVPMQQRGRVGRAADVAALGRGVTGLGNEFAKHKPDFVVVLGDRIEALAAATAASVGGFRVAHLHAGDRAEGVADEAMRHAISKLAHLLLPATALSRRRLLRMGERKEHVINVGSPAIDALRDIEPASEAPQIIVLQHPVGESDAQEKRWMKQTLSATRQSDRVVLMPNHDPGSRGIRAAIREAAVKAVTHLPRQRFASLLKGARVIVGNSSAGLIEAAALRTACVNVGPRQAGRERPGNVIDCGYGDTAVRNALQRARKLDLRRLRQPYGDGRTGPRVADLLAKLDLADIPLRKRNAY